MNFTVFKNMLLTQSFQISIKQSLFYNLTSSLNFYNGKYICNALDHAMGNEAYKAQDQHGQYLGLLPVVNLKAIRIAEPTEGKKRFYNVVVFLHRGTEDDEEQACQLACQQASQQASLQHRPKPDFWKEFCLNVSKVVGKMWMF